MHIDPIDLHFATIVVHTEARRLWLCGALLESEQEDFASELMSRLLGSWDLYDPARGPREAFINSVVASQSVSLLRLRYAKKRGGRAYRVQRDHLDANDGQADGDRSFHVVELRIDLEGAFRKLTRRQREIAFRLGRSSAAAAARELGIPRRTLRDECERIRQAFRDAGLGRYR
jgi:hypothetical protein